MNHSLLPPRGIFVPTQMIFSTQLPAAVLVTWIQLRCLAWRGWATPPLSIPELASLIGIHPARLQRHLAELQDLSTLVCRNAGEGKLILSFPEEPTAKTEHQADTTHSPDPANLNSHLRGSPETNSYFPDRILGYISYQEEQEPVEITNDLEQINIGLEKADKCY
jgi:hypothetical protein